MNFLMYLFFKTIPIGKNISFLIHLTGNQVLYFAYLEFQIIIHSVVFERSLHFYFHRFLQDFHSILFLPA